MAERGVPKKKKKKDEGAVWWQELEERVVDPITLEPIRELKAAPFCLGRSYFDPESLALYMISSGCFENPLNRQALSQGDCVLLDEHLLKWKLRRLYVARAREAASRGAGGRAAAEASAILASLFTLRSSLGQQAEEQGQHEEQQRRRRAALTYSRATFPATAPVATGGATLREGLSDNDDRQSFSREPESSVSLRELLFPALSEAPRPMSRTVDWGTAVRDTKRADDARRRQRERDAEEARRVARNARLAACRRFCEGADSARLDVCDEVKKRWGDAVFDAEKRAEATRLWPADLLEKWRKQRPEKLLELEKIFDKLLSLEEGKDNEVGAKNKKITVVSQTLAPAKTHVRAAQHGLAEAYGFETASIDREPRRSVRLTKVTATAARPPLLLSQALRLLSSDPPPCLRLRQVTQDSRRKPPPIKVPRALEVRVPSRCASAAKEVPPCFKSLANFLRDLGCERLLQNFIDHDVSFEDLGLLADEDYKQIRVDDASRRKITSTLKNMNHDSHLAAFLLDIGCDAYLPSFSYRHLAYDDLDFLAPGDLNDIGITDPVVQALIFDAKRQQEKITRATTISH